MREQSLLPHLATLAFSLFHPARLFNQARGHRHLVFVRPLRPLRRLCLGSVLPAAGAVWKLAAGSGGKAQGALGGGSWGLPLIGRAHVPGPAALAAARCAAAKTTGVTSKFSLYQEQEYYTGFESRILERSNPKGGGRSPPTAAKEKGLLSGGPFQPFSLSLSSAGMLSELSIGVTGAGDGDPPFHQRRFYPTELELPTSKKKQRRVKQTKYIERERERQSEIACGTNYEGAADAGNSPSLVVTSSLEKGWPSSSPQDCSSLAY